MALLLQSFRGVALSYVHGLYAHWQIDLILDHIRSFLGPSDLQMLKQPCPMPHGHSDVRGNTEEGTMERTWSSAPSTPRRRRYSRRVLQVVGVGESTASPRNTDDLIFDDVPVDENWTMMLNLRGYTPTSGYTR